MKILLDHDIHCRPTLWEETVYSYTGLLGLTTKHPCFAGSREEVPGPV